MGSKITSRKCLLSLCRIELRHLYHFVHHPFQADRGLHPFSEALVMLTFRRRQSSGLLLWFETRSLPALTRSYPRHFTLITRTAPCLRQLPSCVAVYPRDSRSLVFYVACPTRSIHQYSSRGLLFQLCSRCSIVCDVLLHGDAGNGFADYIQSQVVQLFEADATFTHVELLAALLVCASEPGGES